MGVTRFQESATGGDIPVSPDAPMPVTDSGGAAVTGTMADAMWDGTGDPASMVALQKAIYNQLVLLNTP